MANPRPPVEAVFAVIAQAAPLLERLQAAKTTLESYFKTIEQYTAEASKTKAEIDGIMVELQAHADAFVALYATEVPVETPAETETE